MDKSDGITLLRVKFCTEHTENGENSLHVYQFAYYIDL